MDQSVNYQKFDLEEENRKFYERFAEFQRRVASNNGSSIVKSDDQYSMDLGNELPIDELIPITQAEKKWQEKHKL